MVGLNRPERELRGAAQNLHARTWVVALCLLAVLLAGALGPVRHALKKSPGRLWPDEEKYERLAESVAEGKGFTFDGSGKGEIDVYPWVDQEGSTAYAAPLHILYVAAFFALDKTAEDIQLCNAFLILVSGVLLFAVVKRVASAPLAACAAILFLLYRPLRLCALDHPLLTEGLYIFLLIAALWCASGPASSRAVLRPAWLGFLVGGLVLVRGEAVLLAPLLLLLGAPRFPKVWKGRYVYVGLAATVVVLAPWMIRNYIQFGYPVLSRSVGGIGL